MKILEPCKLSYQQAEKNCEICSQRPVESGTGQDQAEALDASWIIKINNEDRCEKFFLHSIEYAIGFFFFLKNFRQICIDRILPNVETIDE